MLRCAMKTARWSLLLLTAALIVAKAQIANPELSVKAFSGNSLRLGAADFAKLPAATANATDHDGKKHLYSGVNRYEVAR